MVPDALTTGQIAEIFRAPEWKVRRIVDRLDVEIPRAGLYRLVPRELLAEIGDCLLEPASVVCPLQPVQPQFQKHDFLSQLFWLWFQNLTQCGRNHGLHPSAQPLILFGKPMDGTGEISLTNVHKTENTAG